MENTPQWQTAVEFEDITYKVRGVARIAFNRPEVRNAFRPKTTSELSGLYDAQEDTSIRQYSYQEKGHPQRWRLGF